MNAVKVYLFDELVWLASCHIASLFLASRHILSKYGTYKVEGGNERVEMERENIPTLVFKVPLSSPTESLLGTSPCSGSFVVNFTQDDGLLQEEQIGYNFGDREQRHRMIQNIGQLASRVRGVSAKHKLFTALEALCEYDDCALPIAQQLPAIVQATGAAATTLFQSLRPLILQLCCNLDASVVVEVTEAIRQLVVILDVQCAEEVLFPMIVDLVGSSWTAPRSVGASLLVEIAHHTSSPPDAMDAVREQYMICCRDESIQVRRAACRNLAAWLAVIAPHHRSSFVYPLFNAFLMEEGHDTIQIELVSQVVLVANVIGAADATKYLVHIYHQLCCHRSWRVRYTASIQLAAFAQLVRRPEDLVDDLLGLARDEEVEIVAAVLKQLHVFAFSIPSGVVESKLAPNARIWVDSGVAVIRGAIAQSLFSIILRCDQASTRMGLLERLVGLVHDPNEIVQTTAVSSFSRLAEVAASDEVVLEQLITSIEEAAISSRWRLRSAVAQQAAHLSTCFSEDQFVPVRSLLATLMIDSVASVRGSALMSLGIVARQYGPMWSAESFCFLLDSSSFGEGRLESFFWLRVVLAHCIAALLPIAAGIHPIAAEKLRSRVEHHALRRIPALASDKVSNVRVAAARAVLILRTCRCSIAEGMMDLVHSQLSNDSDPDVVRAAKTIADAPF